MHVIRYYNIKIPHAMVDPDFFFFLPWHKRTQQTNIGIVMAFKNFQENRKVSSFDD